MHCACAVLSSVACLYNIFFPHYLINGTILRKTKSTEHTIRGLIFSKILSENFLILRRIERDVFREVHGSSRDVSVIRVTYE